MNERKHSILIVDDCEADREAYRRMLTHSCGQEYSVSECSNAESALAELNRRCYDCILLDYQLPDRDGLEVLTELRSVYKLSDAAVIFVTGQGDEAVAVHAMKRGAQDYLIKGRFAADGLHVAILRAVERLLLRRKIEEQQQELARLATIDELTSAYNRRQFFEEFRREFSRARRYSLKLCVLMLDIDHFKAVNDTHGHGVGDDVLVAIAQSAQRASRTTDIVGRYGGDEFCVLVPDTDLAGAEALAGRIQQNVAGTDYLNRSRLRFRVTCSIGVAKLDAEMIEPEDLLDAADRALYAAKHAGGNQVAVAVASGA